MTKIAEKLKEFTAPKRFEAITDGIDEWRKAKAIKRGHLPTTYLNEESFKARKLAGADMSNIKLIGLKRRSIEKYMEYIRNVANEAADAGYSHIFLCADTVEGKDTYEKQELLQEKRDLETVARMMHFNTFDIPVKGGYALAIHWITSEEQDFMAHTENKTLQTEAKAAAEAGIRMEDF